LAGSSAGGAGATQWPAAGGTLALASGQYYCPVPSGAETLVQGPAGPGLGTCQGTGDQQLVYTAGPQPGSYQTVDLSDGAHHLVAAGQASEVP